MKIRPKADIYFAANIRRACCARLYAHIDALVDTGASLSYATRKVQLGFRDNDEASMSGASRWAEMTTDFMKSLSSGRTLCCDLLGAGRCPQRSGCGQWVSNRVLPLSPGKRSDVEPARNARHLI